MKYFFLKLVLIGFVVFLLLQTALVIIDSKQNGFTTLSLPTSSNNLITHGPIESFTFKAKENYLGIIRVPLTVNGDGKILFKIKEKTASNWYYDYTYTTEAMKFMPTYPFGFPVIGDAKNKQYQVVIQPTSSSKALISIGGSSYITSYSFPKSLILHNKKLFFSFILLKYLSSFSFTSLFFSFIVALLLIKPKRTVSRIKYFIVNSSLLLGQKRITNNLFLFSLFVFYFYVNLISLNFLTALLWAVGLYVLYKASDKVGGKLSLAVPFFFLLLLLFSFLTKHFLLANTATEMVWLFLFAAIMQFIINFVISFFKNKNSFQIKKMICQLFFVIAAVCLLIAAFDKTYLLGGDDSRIYFIYPQSYFQNYIANGGLNGGVSSVINLLPIQSISAFTIFMISIKTLLQPFNLQTIFFIVNILGGLFFFYILLNYLLPSKRFEYFIARILASLFYVFSIFNFYTLFNSLLLAQFLISLFPLSMYFYIKGIKEKQYYLLCLCAVIWSVFSFLLISLPWFAGGIIAFLPIIILLFWKEKRKFIALNVFFGILLFFLNAYWITAFPYSYVTNNSITANNSLISNRFRNQNEQGIIDTAGINKVFFPLVNLYHYDIQKNFHWPFLPIFTSWYLKLLIFNSAFFIFIVWTGIRIQNDPFKKIYITSSLCFLISVYFFTVNIGNAGINLFVFLNNYVPGFVMFRNMYDKFGYAMALSYSLLFFISLLFFLTSKINIFYKKIITIFFFIVIFLNALPFLTGQFYSFPIWTTKNTYPTTNNLNHDYMNLVAYIQSQQNQSRYLWLPLNGGNIAQIQDDNDPNHYYNGVSPLMLLSGKNDYSGLESFGSIGTFIKNYISHREYEQLGKIYQQYNIRYIVVNKTISKDIRQSYICGENICNLQDRKYENFFLGKKIKDFGSRYSLYEINPKFINDDIYITHNINVFPYYQEAQYQKISNEEYAVHISHLQKNELLVFLNPYFSNWNVYTFSNTVLPNTNHHKIFGYANGWTLDKNAVITELPSTDYRKNLDGSISMDIKLQFAPDRVSEVFTTLAILSYTSIFIYVLIILIRKKFHVKAYEIKEN